MPEVARRRLVPVMMHSNQIVSAPIVSCLRATDIVGIVLVGFVFVIHTPVPQFSGGQTHYSIPGRLLRPTAPRGPRVIRLSLIHISEPTRLRRISYAVFCLK